MVLRCTLDVGSGTSELGIDLGYPAAQPVTLKLNASRADATTVDVTTTFELPDPAA